MKGQGKYTYEVKNYFCPLKIYSYIHVSHVYKKGNLCLCHRLPTRLIIHTLRGLKILRSAYFKQQIWDTSFLMVFIWFLMSLLLFFSSFLTSLSLADGTKQWPFFQSKQPLSFPREQRQKFPRKLDMTSVTNPCEALQGSDTSPHWCLPLRQPGRSCTNFTSGFIMLFLCPHLSNSRIPPARKSHSSQKENYYLC